MNRLERESLLLRFVQWLEARGFAVVDHQVVYAFLEYDNHR